MSSFDMTRNPASFSSKAAPVATRLARPWFTSLEATGSQTVAPSILSFWKFDEMTSML